MPGENEVDVAAIAAEIGSDLFGGNDPVPSDDSAPVSPPNLGQSASPVPDPQPGLTASQIKALPKSWKKELEPVWAKSDPALHDYVYEREANMMRGFQQYQGGYNNWDALIKPYQKLLSEHPNVNPVELMHGLMNSHLRLLQASPEQRRAYAAEMLSHYGIDINAAPSGEQQPAPQTNAELLQVRKELAELRNGFTRSQKAVYEAGVAQNLSAVEKFGADPANKYFEEAGADILHLLQTGVAKDLPSAYQKACWLNPSIRAKMIAEQQSESAGTVIPPTAKFPNVNGSSDVKPRKQRPGSIDDTINGIVAKHFPAH